MRILLADHHILFREGLIGLLSRDAGIEVVGTAGLARDAIKKAIDLAPDILLLDLDLPDQNGMEVLRAVYNRNPAINVVILTTTINEEQLLTAVQHGARGYLVKDVPVAQVIESLKGVMRGETAFRRADMRRLVDRLAQQYNQENQANSLEQLTDREREVLERICVGASNFEIASTLKISENTVKAHVRKILSKLNLQNRREARNHAIKQGLLNPTDGSWSPSAR